MLFLLTLYAIEGVAPWEVTYDTCSLEGEEVVHDLVHEEAVVADNEHAACEVREVLLECL